MKAKEFTAVTKDNIGYDIVEDIYQFMLNDGEFFRKNFFPIAKKYSDNQKEMMEKTSMETWSGCVDQAINEYFTKFKINGKPEKIISTEDKVAICNKIVQGLSKHPVKNAQ